MSVRTASRPPQTRTRLLTRLSEPGFKFSQEDGSPDSAPEVLKELQAAGVEDKELEQYLGPIVVDFFALLRDRKIQTLVGWQNNLLLPAIRDILSRQ